MWTEEHVSGESVASIFAVVPHVGRRLSTPAGSDITTPHAYIHPHPYFATLAPMQTTQATSTGKQTDV